MLTTLLAIVKLKMEIHIPFIYLQNDTYVFGRMLRMFSCAIAFTANYIFTHIEFCNLKDRGITLICVWLR